MLEAQWAAQRPGILWSKNALSWSENIKAMGELTRGLHVRSQSSARSIRVFANPKQRGKFEQYI